MLPRSKIYQKQGEESLYYRAQTKCDFHLHERHDGPLCSQETLSAKAMTPSCRIESKRLAGGNARSTLRLCFDLTVSGEKMKRLLSNAQIRGSTLTTWRYPRLLKTRMCSSMSSTSLAASVSGVFSTTHKRLSEPSSSKIANTPAGALFRVSRLCSAASTACGASWLPDKAASMCNFRAWHSATCL